MTLSPSALGTPRCTCVVRRYRRCRILGIFAAVLHSISSVTGLKPTGLMSRLCATSPTLTTRFLPKPQTTDGPGGNGRPPTSELSNGRTTSSACAPHQSSHAPQGTSQRWWSTCAASSTMVTVMRLTATCTCSQPPCRTTGTFPARNSTSLTKVNPLAPANAIPATSPCGKQQSRGNQAGRHRGVMVAPAGTLSARLWPQSTWVRSLIFTAAA